MEMKASVFLKQLSHSAEILHEFTLSAAEPETLQLPAEALRDFTLPYFSEFVSEHVALMPFSQILPASKVSFSALLTRPLHSLHIAPHTHRLHSAESPL